MTGAQIMQVDYTVLKNRCGRILGCPTSEAEWNAQQREDVDTVIIDGLRQYYTPPEVDQFGSHTWSFLYPRKTLTTIANQTWYDLPDDFAILDAANRITFTDAEQSYLPIKLTTPGRLRQKHSTGGDTTGTPEFAATQIKRSDGTAPQVWEIGFYPTPDSEYEVEFAYQAAAVMLTVERPYPLGGPLHGQGILLSCLAAAELFEFEQRGTHWEAFITQLKADIAMDSRRGPTTVGYSSPNRYVPRGIQGPGRNSVYSSGSYVTYNGVDYS